MGLLSKILNRLRPAPKEVMLTSFSDNMKYPNFCALASKDNNVFNSFRSNPVHDSIVDVINKEQGQTLLNAIDLTEERLLEIEKFKENDKFGGPRVYEYEKLGVISPATIRYIKVLYELEDIFKTFGEQNIVELGVGYGGQARILCQKHNVRSYSFIDLPEVIELTKKYLGNFESNTEYNFLTADGIVEKEYDMFISNYAFTELRRELQESYLETVILKCKKGYILYNDINPDDFKSIKKEELVERIPNAKILPENPSTSPKNCVIVWGI